MVLRSGETQVAFVYKGQRMFFTDVDDDPVYIARASDISEMTVDHSNPNCDLTRIVMTDGNVHLVRESMEEIEAEIQQEEAK